MKTKMLGQTVEIKPKGKKLAAYVNGKLLKDVQPSAYMGVMLRRTKTALLNQMRFQ